MLVEIFGAIQTKNFHSSKIMEKTQVSALHFFVSCLSLLSLVQSTLLDSDKQALLDFANNMPHSRPLNWNKQFPVCFNWTGVKCNEDGTRVVSLRLPCQGFHGPIPHNTISRLSALQVLSLRSNAINGTFPLDLGSLKNLTFLYLQHNKFSGPLTLDFSAWKNLTVVNLSDNEFSGKIPSSFSSLSRLYSLNLAKNLFSGEILDLHLPNLELLNLSHNNLSGHVPKPLQRFPKSSFFGNNGLLLDYVDSLVVLVPHEQNLKNKNISKLSQRGLIGIIIAFSVFGVLGLGFVLFICLLRKSKAEEFTGKLEKGNMSHEKAISKSRDDNNKLVFFEGCDYAFDLEDLLCASAEVLGKGTHGMAYKAILDDGNFVVVKRLKDVSVGKREFEQTMDLIGSIKHANVIELRAYYYSKDEKLMVYDYYTRSSVSSMLHGELGENRTPLNWDTRLNISIGAAKGIARIHEENGGKLVHGNVKSSNIFLNSLNYGCVSDLGLSTIISALAPPIARAAGYRAPEVTDTRKATQASDVYSFGVVLLELLTGKSPVQNIQGDEVIYLVRWVQSVVREEWTAEVFDIELLRCPNIEEELVEMLQIGMSCVVRMPDQRPKMSELVKMIHNVRGTESGNKASSWGKSGSSTTIPSSPGY